MRDKTTVKNIITRMYGNMVYRGKSKNRFVLPKSEFTDLVMSSQEFANLRDEWLRSGCDDWLVPSVDRVDNDKGYTADNIRFTTRRENVTRGVREVCSTFITIEKAGVVLSFTSFTDLADHFNVSRPAITRRVRAKKLPDGWTIRNVTEARADRSKVNRDFVSVSVRMVRGTEDMTFESAASAAEFLGMPRSHGNVLTRAARSRSGKYKGWSVILGESRSGMRVRIANGKDELVFDSLTEAAKHLDGCIQAVSVALKAGKPYKGWAITAC